MIKEENFNSVFNKIGIEAKELKQILQRSNKEELDFKFGCSIYEFFEVLHDLFTKLDLLTVSDSKDESRFRFIAAYPDETYDESNIMTYDVVRRTPFVVDSKAIQGSTKYVKPRFLKESFNDVSGNIENLYVAVFNNTISINIFSNKARTLNNMARIIESIFYKYSSYLKKHVDEFVFIGMNSIQFTDRYDSKDRLFSRELQFNVITSEYFILELEQLKSIDFSNTK